MSLYLQKNKLPILLCLCSWRYAQKDIAKETSIDRLIKKLKEISEAEEFAINCGGMYSSDKLKKTLQLIEEVDQYCEHPQYEKVVSILNNIKGVWESSLAKHNAKQSKFIEYDIETGIPINSDK